MTGISTIKKSAVVPHASSVAEKRRILMIGMHLTETRGGISTLTGELLRSSLTDDFAIDFIASQSENRRGFAKAKLAARAIFSFLAKCLRGAPELAYVHVGSNASLYRESIFIILAKIFRLKTIAHFHAGDFDFYYSRQTGFGQKFIRRAIGLSDALIAVSEDSARLLRKLVGAENAITLIQNGINTGEFDFAAARENDASDDGFVRLLFVGAIGKLKGEDDLICALRILRERGAANFKISMLGCGAENLRAKFDAANIGDAVEFLGAVALEDRPAFYRRADIFVLPTYGEAMSMSIIEAMAAGLPVVTTAVGGNPELVESGANGWLVASGDSAALAEKLELLIGDKQLRENCGDNGRRKAQSDFDIRVGVEKIRRLINKIQTKK